MSKPNILFFPSYFYLTNDEFVAIAKEIKDDFQPCFIKMNLDRSDYNQSDIPYPTKYYFQQGIKLIKLTPDRELEPESKTELVSESSPGKITVGRKRKFLCAILSLLFFTRLTPSRSIKKQLPNSHIISLLCHFKDYYDITLYLFALLIKNEKILPEVNKYYIKLYRRISQLISDFTPSALIMNSDVGHAGIMITIDVAVKKNIPVFIIPTCDIEPRSKIKLGVLSNFLIRFYSHSQDPYSALMKIYIMRNSNAIGNFDKRTKILVSSNHIKDSLINKGVSANRIVTYSRTHLFHPCVEVHNKKQVTFYSECLHEIYGDDYIKRTHCEIAELFKALRLQDSSINIVIKPHPREISNPQIFSSLITPYFSDFYIETKRDTTAVLQESTVNIAHFSKVLITSCIHGIPILCLNTLQDRNRSFLQPSEIDTLEIQKLDHLIPALSKILSDSATRTHNIQIGQLVKHRFEYQNEKKTITEILAEFLKDK